MPTPAGPGTAGPAQPGTAAEAGCEETPDTPDRLEIDARYDAWVTACRSTDGAVLTLANITAASTLVVFPVESAVDWEFGDAPGDTIGELAVASAVPAGTFSTGAALLPPGVSVTVTSQTGESFTLDMQVDARGTATAMAAGSVGDWLASKVPQSRTGRYRDLVTGCAQEFGAMAQTNPGVQWQDLLRQAFSVQQSCASLYTAVKQEVAAPPGNAAAVADEAAELARSNPAKKAGVWDDILKAARSGAVRLFTS
ncbi:hypothetical protein DQ239_12010 [Blastococcus sp. TF02-09]|uniref:hypothetical protein n=1 Tax=Blastococcus sp. TF02-09 TaxID=2250576 RepID=UPI000DEB326A|nr:hypothetical protein [Blastococcus sp. TF02-9]RBY76913.1 hypothetical protein DQ239_12010 [Blastococcus sp. TF02-9]